MSDAEKLTIALVKAGATREKVTAIIDGYGDAIDWSGYTLTEICNTFNVAEVTE